MMDGVTANSIKLADYEIFLDDERMPSEAMKDAVIVRDFWEFKRTINERGIPKFISFDHDLGCMTYTGKSCAEYLICRMFDYPKEALKEFDFYVHSQNPIGAENIRRLLEQFIEEMTQ